MKIIVLAALATIPITASAMARTVDRPRYTATSGGEGIYCVRAANLRAIDENPSTAVRHCRKERDWRMYGLAFRRQPADTVVAQK